MSDSLNLEDKSSKKFIDELKRKKEKANRLTAKPNEVNPNLVQIEGPQIQPKQRVVEVQRVDDMYSVHTT